jgi:Glycosyl transferase family 2
MAEQQTIAGWTVTVPPPTVPIEAAAEPPTISVLITYYKGQDTVAEAVRSVLEQTVAPFEIVICDDGSPDDIDAGLGSLRDAVKIVRKENGGTGSALNAAARAAGGEYVVQLDVDDAYLPRRIEAISAVLTARPDIDILASDARIEQGDKLVTTLGAVHPYPEDDQRLALLRTCTVLWPAVRRSLVLGAGGWDESCKAAEDWDCWLRLVLDGAVVAYVHEPLYRWRLTPGSRSSANLVALYEDQVQMTEKALRESPLDARERRHADALLVTRRLALVREEARRAIETDAPDARRRSFNLVTGKGFDRGTRVKAVVAVASPRLAARLMDRRTDHTDSATFELALRGFSAPPRAHQTGDG